MKTAGLNALVKMSQSTKVILGVALPLVAVFVTGFTPAKGEAGAGSLMNLPNDSTIVAAAVASFHASILTGDRAGAMRLLAKDAAILESGGIETRDQYFADHFDEDVAFAKAVTETRVPLTVLVRGTTAWVYGTSRVEGEFNGRAVKSSGAELVVLTKNPRGRPKQPVWLIRAIHWSSRKRP